MEKGCLSCNSDAPQGGSARSDSTRVVKVNHHKMKLRKTRPHWTWINNKTRYLQCCIHRTGM